MTQAEFDKIQEELAAEYELRLIDEEYERVRRLDPRIELIRETGRLAKELLEKSKAFQESCPPVLEKIRAYLAEHYPNS